MHVELLCVLGRSSVIHYCQYCESLGEHITINQVSMTEGFYLPSKPKEERGPQILDRGGIMVSTRNDDRGEKCSYGNKGTGKVELIHGGEHHVCKTGLWSI